VHECVCVHDCVSLLNCSCVVLLTIIEPTHKPNAHKYTHKQKRKHTQDPKAFLVDLKTMFDSLDPEYILYHTSNVIESIIETLRSHQVRVA
jgi:hypothetical protein